MKRIILILCIVFLVTANIFCRDLTGKLAINGGLESWMTQIDNPADIRSKIMNNLIYGGELKYGIASNIMLGIGIEYWAWNSSKYEYLDSNLETRYYAVPCMINFTYIFDVGFDNLKPYIKLGTGVSWVVINTINTLEISNTKIIVSSELIELRPAWQSGGGLEFFLDKSMSINFSARFLFGGYIDLAGISFGGGIGFYF